MHINNKMATEDNVYDVVLAYLYTSGNFFRQRNRPTRSRRFWVHDVLRRQDDLGEYARLVGPTRTSAG